MKIIIFGNGEETKNLYNKTSQILDNLGLSEMIQLEETTNEELKKELNIKKEPALIIEEESIEFKDTIFEGLNPPESEIEAMITSIIGGSGIDSCAPSSCSSCGSASVCGVEH